MHRRMHCLAILIATAAAACTADDEAGTDAGRDTATAAGTAATGEGDFSFGAGVLSTPESVFWDEQEDVYYVSNINGAPTEKDDNGYISRVRPDGTIDAPKWIDGAAEGVTLHAPKGMAVSGDTLWVADIDTVRAFHRTTGAPLFARGVENASFLNDLATGPDGTLYVTDTGVDASFQPSGTERVLRFDGDGATAIASGAALSSPNGIVVADDAIILVPFGGAAVMRVPLDGSAPDTIAMLPGGQLDGVVRTRSGDLLVSSWESSTVYRVDAGGNVSVLAEGLEAPADIGYDARRDRVLVPLFNANRVEVRSVTSP